jgi:uncharacterized membrane protein YfcA
MKLIKVPDWWDSIRAIIAFCLTASFCASIFVKEIPADKVSGLKELTLLALTFYFVLKKRPEENGGGNEPK